MSTTNRSARPQLTVEIGALSRIARDLAREFPNRQRFIANPRQYLSGKGLLIGACEMVESAMAPTAETVTSYIVAESAIQVQTVVSGPGVQTVITGPPVSLYIAS